MMERGADNLSARLIEVVTLVYAPSSVRDLVVETAGSGRNRTLVVSVGLIAGLVCGLRFPREDSTIAADGIYLHRCKRGTIRRSRPFLRTVLASLEKKAFSTASL